MSTDTSNKGQSDVIVEVCNIVASNGKQLNEVAPDGEGWHAITLTESMGFLKGDTSFVSGEILIMDAINIMDEMQLNIDDVVELKFKTPQKDSIKFTGKVFNVDLSAFETKRSVTVKFCSVEKIVADQIKINGVYKNMPYSEIAKRIFAPLNVLGGKKIYAEPTKNKGTLIFNNKSPVDCINTITKAALSTNYTGANYVFFEQAKGQLTNHTGIFQFVSLESLIDPEKNKPTMIYYYDAPPPGFGKLAQLGRIKTHKVVSLPNLVSRVRGGMFGSTVIANDLMKRQHTMKTFNYDESYNKYKSVDHNMVSGRGQGSTALMNNKNYSQRNHSFVQFAPTHCGSFDGVDTNHGEEVADTVLARRSLLQQINSIRLQIKVGGDSNRHIGEIVEIHLPAIEEKNETSGGRIDKMFTGKYLVSKIKHILTADTKGYDTYMTLIKGSYAEPLPNKA